MRPLKTKYMESAMSIHRLMLSAALISGSAFAGQPASTTASDAIFKGEYRQAVAELRQGSVTQVNDPARLINLGTAYARLGDVSRASEAFRRAMYSDARYDLELADGTVIDSRDAARMALANLEQQARKQTASR